MPECPIGTQQHMSYRCESIEQLLALRDQIKATGVQVSRVIDHGFIMSAYFKARKKNPTIPNQFCFNILFLILFI